MLKEFLLDLVFPVYCQGCFTEGEYLCLACQAKLEMPEGRCLVCSKGSFLGRIHPGCQSRGVTLDGLLVAARYHDPAIRNLIWHFKYDSVKGASLVLSQILADFFVAQKLEEYFASSAVIPVPLHRRRFRERGFNQAELLAEGFASRLGLEYLPILKRTKNSQSQVDLERGERLENVKNLFAAPPRPSLGERKIILVDDVATTGATLNECAKELKKQSPSEIWGLVVARN